MKDFFSKYRQFLCFALIGVANTLIHGGILMIAVEKMLWAVTFAHLLAFTIANIFSYTLNSRFTFKVAFSFKGYARFLLASLLSLVLTLLLAVGLEQYGAHYLIGFALIVVLVPVMSFMIMRFWVFSVGNKPTAR